MRDFSPPPRGEGSGVGGVGVEFAGKERSPVLAAALKALAYKPDPAPPTPTPPHEGEGIMCSPTRHCFTSIADLSPSEKRLKEIEVMKIIAPGSAATQGWT